MSEVSREYERFIQHQVRNGVLQLQNQKGMKKGFWKTGSLKVAPLKRLSVSRRSVQEEVQDEPKQTSRDEKCKRLEEHMENSELYKEYESIPMCRRERECTLFGYLENVDKNRFQDVVPYDDTRVKLVPTKDNSIGYINASHIRVKIGELEWHYIATQGPLPNTCQDFWQMVWEQGVSVIAMVTAEQENGREKSFRYWPRLDSQDNTMTFGQFKITTQNHIQSGCCVKTELTIKHLLTGEKRTACHLQYTDWPTYSCPEDLKGFLAYLEEIQSSRRYTNTHSPPLVVHCSAGAGRSGVVILSKIMIACLENDELLDIPKFLRMLREQRMMMVQTLSQYTFVYKVLIEYHRNSKLELR